MKSLIILTLAAMSLAAPSGGEKQARGGCTPATYACATNPTSSVPGWQVCDVTGTWIYAGDCPPNTNCQFNTVNGSPYCLPV